MSASIQPTAGNPLCGKWMPRKQAACARGAGHGGPCATPEAMKRQRQRTAQRTALHGRRDNPAVKARWTKAYKLRRFHMTQEQFDRLLAIQEYACAMCRLPFADGQPVFIDHDHGCCEEEKSSCGDCVRGLLCLRCNVALGYIERMDALARAYLASPPGQIVMRVLVGSLAQEDRWRSLGARYLDTVEGSGSSPLRSTGTT